MTFPRSVFLIFIHQGGEPMAAWTPRDGNAGVAPRSYSLHHTESPEHPDTYFGKSGDLATFSKEQFL